MMALERKQLTRNTLNTTPVKKTRVQAELEFTQLLNNGGSPLDALNSLDAPTTTHTAQTTTQAQRVAPVDSKYMAIKRVVDKRASELEAEATAPEKNIQKKSTGRGGARAGAGRPAGSLSSKTQLLVAQLTADGISPLEYMLTHMRDVTNTPAFRAEMAKAAAPYIHPKLSSTEMSAPGGKPLVPRVIGTVPLDAAGAVQFYKDLLG